MAWVSLFWIAQLGRKGQQCHIRCTRPPSPAVLQLGVPMDTMRGSEVCRPAAMSLVASPAPGVVGQEVEFSDR